MPTLERTENIRSLKNAVDPVKPDSQADQAATVDGLSKKLTLLTSTVTELSQKLDQLQSEVKQLQDKVKVRKKTSISEGVLGKNDCGDVNNNIEKLRSLSYIEVSAHNYCYYHYIIIVNYYWKGGGNFVSS